MSAETRDRIRNVLSALHADAPETLADFTKRAAAAFSEDMKPVCKAIEDALNGGDAQSLRDLRALLPQLLARATANPTLADLLAHQLGTAFLEGFQQAAKPSPDRREA
jgi:DNA-binding GntR family transcriptional regulator